MIDFFDSTLLLLPIFNNYFSSILSFCISLASRRRRDAVERWQIPLGASHG